MLKFNFFQSGLVVPNYSTRSDYDRMYALGNTIYGQMTAGSFWFEHLKILIFLVTLDHK